jgi:hypothetical protein
MRSVVSRIRKARIWRAFLVKKRKLSKNRNAWSERIRTHAFPIEPGLCRSFIKFGNIGSVTTRRERFTPRNTPLSDANGSAPPLNIAPGVVSIGRNGSHLVASEDVLPDHRVDSPVAVNHLGDAEVDADCNQRDCLILCQLLGRHQELAHLAERIAQGEIDR